MEQINMLAAWAADDAIELQRKEFIQKMRAGYKLGELHLSYSSLSRFRKSPRAFIDYKMKPKDEPTDDMIIGNMVDCLVLTPHEFESKFVCDRDIVIEIGGKARATNKYKEWVETQKASKKQIVSGEDFDDARRRAAAVQSNEAAMKVLAKCSTYQKKVEFTLKGVKFVGYLDADGEVVVDLKTMADASPRKAERTILDREYWLQGGVYTLGNDEVKPYYIIAVDKSCNVSVTLIEESFIVWSISKLERLVDEFIECVENDWFDKSYEYRAPTLEGFYVMPRPPFLN